MLDPNRHITPVLHVVQSPRRRRRVHAALRAVTAARLYSRGEMPTLAQAAIACGSTPAHVQAAATIMRAEDEKLLALVLGGMRPLVSVACQARRQADLLAAWRAADDDASRANARCRFRSYGENTP
jgi:hypothetical protein